MDQEKIWDHFQNSSQAEDVFDNAYPRYEFLSRKIKTGTSVLNIGVGRGGLERILCEKGVLVHSLDPSDVSIENLKKTLSMNERAKVGFSQAIPFSDKKFDAVIMSEVLEHLDDETLKKTLLEVRRVLKTKALFLGTVPANENLLENYAVCPHCGVGFHRWGHVQSFSRRRIEETLSFSGFLVIKNELRAFPDWRRKSVFGFLKNSIRYMLGRFGIYMSSPNIYFSALN
jgi:SAM-dependent methyltransferase